MIVPLNLVMTYPVNWGCYEVFRDFVQNFYDSVDCRRWRDAFRYEYRPDEMKLCMWVEEVTFSYEWLMHIGASTKTSTSGENAGYFGEGFKIASLCAIRDRKWGVRMSSGDWTLNVIELDETIDGRFVKMLAYDVEKCGYISGSRLELSSVDEMEMSVFETVLLSFYYPENPLLGECLWEGRYGAVYTRSSYHYPEGLPCTYDFGRKGIVFCAYQALGSNPFDLVVCDHTYRNKDRERKALYSFNVIDVFNTVFYKMDATGAMKTLEKMRRYWNTVPTKRIDIHSWFPTVSILIDRVAQNTAVKKQFLEKYPNLLYLPAMHSNRDVNRRHLAKAWLKQQDEHYLLVQRGFERLGYPSLEDLCEQGGGFVRDDTPTQQEMRCFELLRELVSEHFAVFFCFEQEPAFCVIRNQTSAYHGMATLVREKKARVNGLGMKIRSRLVEIYLKEICFQKENFYDALATYVHECCHIFGGDSSEAFSYGLTVAMEMLMSLTAAIEKYRVRWEALFAQ